MNQAMDKVQKSQLRTDLPAFRPGDTVRVNVKLREIETGEKGGEKEKERIQPFEGVVIKRRGHTAGASFTVRRVSFGIGVERIFPLHSPTIASIEIVQQGNVRRAKLYYLRGLKGKSARIKRAGRTEQTPAAETKASE